MSVTVGANVVPRDLARLDGWDYAMNGTAVEIHGPTCDALKTGAAPSVGIHFGCPN